MRGMIVCGGSDEKMRHAAMAIPGLEIRHYVINFSLLEAESPKSSRT